MKTVEDGLGLSLDSTIANGPTSKFNLLPRSSCLASFNLVYVPARWTHSWRGAIRFDN
jgi:hypothetical protein